VIGDVQTRIFKRECTRAAFYDAVHQLAAAKTVAFSVSSINVRLKVKFRSYVEAAVKAFKDVRYPSSQVRRWTTRWKAAVSQEERGKAVSR
jgi:hypothetical protein